MRAAERNLRLWDGLAFSNLPHCHDGRNQIASWIDRGELTMTVYRTRFFNVCLLAAFMTSICVVDTTRGDLVIDLPELTIFSDNVNPATGELSVFLTLTGTDLTSPPQVSSFNLDFSRSGTGLNFAAAQAATTTPLFSGGVFLNFGNASNVQTAHDVVTAVTAFNNAGLIKVPFTVTPGNVGTTYALTFGALNQMSDQLALPLSLTLVPGSITVAAIPEIAAWQGLSIVGLVCAAAVYVNRRRKFAT